MILCCCAGKASRSELPFSPLLGGSRLGSVLSGSFADIPILSKEWWKTFSLITVGKIAKRCKLRGLNLENYKKGQAFGQSPPHFLKFHL